MIQPLCIRGLLEIINYLEKEFGLPNSLLSRLTVCLFHITVDSLYQISQDAI